MKQVDIIERAAEIHWGQYLDVSNIVLQNNETLLQMVDTPESLLIEKDKFWKMPQECRTVAEIILNLPEEMFTANGKVKKGELLRVMKEKLGWNERKTAKVTKKMTTCLTS